MGWHKHIQLAQEAAGAPNCLRAGIPCEELQLKLQQRVFLSLHTLVHHKDFPAALEKTVLPITQGKFLLHKGNPILKPLPSNEASRVLIGFIRV